MKKTLVITAIILTGICSSCEIGYNSSFNHSDGRTTINIRDETGRMAIEYRGDITLTDDETAIESISPGGYLKYEKNNIKVEAQNNTNGEVVCKVYDDNNEIPLNDKRQRALSNAIKQMINVGFDAKGRAGRLYKKGGTSGVLDDIAYLKNDYVKSLYFQYLLAIDSLSENEMTAIAKGIGLQLGSDYEKGQLLGKVAAGYLKSDQTFKAYMDAVKSIGSDYEKANALKNVIKLQLTDGQVAELLVVTNTISSDFEKANVLKELTAKDINTEEVFDRFLDVTNGIGSDYEKANVLKQLVESGVFAGPVFNKLINVTGNIGSDFEKANVLKKLAEVDFTTEDEWVSLINGTAKVSSNFEKSNVMVMIAKKMPKSERVRNAYMEVAKTVTSDMEYSSVMKAVQ